MNHSQSLLSTGNPCIAVIPPFPMKCLIAPTLTLATLLCSNPGFAVQTAPETDSRPQDVYREVRSKGKQVLTFIGYSGGGFENDSEMLQLTRDILKQYSPETTVVNIGATAMGIGKIYTLAKEMRFETMGIVSSLVRSSSKGTASDCDHVYVIADQQYGGFSKPEMAAYLQSHFGSDISAEASGLNVCGSGLFSNEQLLEVLYQNKVHLTPTSQTMIQVSDVIIGIGGGPTSCAELFYAVSTGKTVHYFPHRMNSQLSPNYTGDRLWGEAEERLRSLTCETFPNFHPNPRPEDLLLGLRNVR